MEQLKLVLHTEDIVDRRCVNDLDDTKKKKKEEKEVVQSETESSSSSDGEEAAKDSSLPFPKSCYDPDTLELLKNPVVAPDGISRERKAENEEVNDLEASLDASTESGYKYPNRALLSYIQQVTEEQEFSKLAQLGKTVRTGWKQLVEGDSHPLPDALYCPISHDLFHEAVTEPGGITYEKAAILHWLQNQQESPVTRQPLTVDQLRDNHAIVDILEHLATENHHPVLVQWKNDHATWPPALLRNTAASTTRTYPSNYEELRAAEGRRWKRERVVWVLIILVAAACFAFPSFITLCVVLAFIVLAFIKSGWRPSYETALSRTTGEEQATGTESSTTSSPSEEQHVEAERDGITSEGANGGEGGPDDEGG